MEPVVGHRLLYSWKTQTGEIDGFTLIGKHIKVPVNSPAEFAAVTALLSARNVTVDVASETLVRTG